MRVLVTRPEPEAQQTAARLRELGHEAIVAPLLDIRFLDGEEIALDGVQAVVATSANGVRALARRTTRRDVPLYAVGTQTADVARQTGFSNVHDAAGDADALAELVIARADPKGGAVFYAAGAQTRGGLEDSLVRHGFDLRKDVVYRAVGADVLPPDVRDALARGMLDAVMIFSPRTARIFGELIARADLITASQKLRVLCISEAAAAEIRPFGLPRVEVAPHPNQDALLALFAPRVAS